MSPLKKLLLFAIPALAIHAVVFSVGRFDMPAGSSAWEAWYITFMLFIAAALCAWMARYEFYDSDWFFDRLWLVGNGMWAGLCFSGSLLTAGRMIYSATAGVPQ